MPDFTLEEGGPDDVLEMPDDDGASHALEVPFSARPVFKDALDGLDGPPEPLDAAQLGAKGFPDTNAAFAFFVAQGFFSSDDQPSLDSAGNLLMDTAVLTERDGNQIKLTAVAIARVLDGMDE